jgi:hypothetical protein
MVRKATVGLVQQAVWQNGKANPQKPTLHLPLRQAAGR